MINDFDKVNFPFLAGNSLSPLEFIRFAKASSHAADFNVFRTLSF